MTDSATEIQTEVEGQQVRGRIVVLTQRALEVEILFPYEGISQGLSIPAIAMPAAVAGGHTFANEAGLTTKGRNSADSLLGELYRACSVVAANKDVLAAEYALIRGREESVAQIGGDLFHEARRRLKTRLKAGEITGPEYQRALAPLALSAPV